MPVGLHLVQDGLFYCLADRNSGSQLHGLNALMRFVLLDKGGSDLGQIGFTLLAHQQRIKSRRQRGDLSGRDGIQDMPFLSVLMIGLRSTFTSSGLTRQAVPQKKHIVIDSIQLTSFNGQVQDRFGIAGC
jgi:hypothetical protein